MSELAQFLNLSSEKGQQVFLSAAIVVVAIVLASLLRRLVLHYVEEAEARYRAAKGINRVIAFVAFVAVASIWASDVTTVLAGLTVLGTGLAIAMRDTVMGFVAWTDIIFRRPFEQGDRIEINGVKGDVVDIRMLHTTLMEVGNWVDGDQSTGRLVHIPNGWIFQHALQNYTQGFAFIWNELPITVTFQSDWKAAREIMLELAEESSEIVEEQASKQLRELSKKYLVHYSLLTPFVYVRVADNGVRLTLRYLCEVRKRRGTTHAFTLRILQNFSKHPQIELAYPTYGLSSMKGPQFGPVPEQAGNNPSSQDQSSSASDTSQKPGSNNRLP